MINVFKQDSHLYFVNKQFVVMANPYNGHQLTIVKRTQGDPLEKDWIKIHSVLKGIGMKLKGQPIKRDDGLWSHELEVSDEVGS